jgi:hypothetical protein
MGIIDAIYHIFLHPGPIGGEKSYRCSKITRKLKISKLASAEEIVDKLKNNIDLLVSNQISKEEAFYYIYLKNKFNFSNEDIMTKTSEEVRLKEWNYFSSQININN